MTEQGPIMRWMTMAWWRGDVPQQTADGYAAHFDSIRNRLPVNLRDFHDRVTLHDAKLLSLKIDLLSRSVRMELAGYHWNTKMPPDRECVWHLCYEGVETVRSLATIDNGLGGPAGFGDLGYDELTIAGDGIYSHAMLFSTSVELQVTFRRLDARRVDRQTTSSCNE